MRFLKFALFSSLLALALTGCNREQPSPITPAGPTPPISIVHTPTPVGTPKLISQADLDAIPKASKPYKIVLIVKTKNNPFFIPMILSDICAGYISMRYGFKGPNYATTSACATSNHAIIDAMMYIQRGLTDVMVAGGSEAGICQMGVGGFNAMKALSTRNDAPEKASRPFDLQRDGFVMGEGGATLILEELEHAKSRGAKIYAELSGFGSTADAYHITLPAPGGEGAVRSMRMSLMDAGLAPEKIDYINVHGTSTPPGDISETQAIKTVFGDNASKVAISSTKSMTGHLLGAAGAIEAIISVLAIDNQVAPPTINLEFPDPACDLDYVPNVARPMRIDAAMSNGFGFGGHNATLIFTKYAE